MNEKAMLIDVSKCTACRGCQVACKQWNQLPAEITKNTGTYENPPDLSSSTFTRILFKEELVKGQLKWLFRTEQCMHCTDAGCIKVCPVDARAKDEFGFTEIDIMKCIGCGLCVRGCPFDVPRIDNKTNKATGCWFCLDRVVNGMEPACANTCPSGAIKYGERSDLLAYAHEAVAESKNGKLYLYGEHEFGGLHVLYLLPEEPELYGLPRKDVVVANEFEAYALLEEQLKFSPVRDEVLTAAALKYFGHVRV